MTAAALLLLAAGCAPTAPSWVAIGGGSITIGDARFLATEMPEQVVSVAPFELTAHEITNAQFRAFTQATGYLTVAERGVDLGAVPGEPEALSLPGGLVFVPDAGWQFVPGASWRHPEGPGSTLWRRWRHPVVLVTAEDAEAYAAWVGGRLPTEEEWEFAAREGRSGEVHPWGEAPAAERANTWQGAFPVYNSGQDGYLASSPVGRFPASGLGLYDMLGNVWELTATPFYPSHTPGALAEKWPGGFDPSSPGPPVRVIKGGSFLCDVDVCHGYRPAARQAQDSGLPAGHVGFRVARGGVSPG